MKTRGSKKAVHAFLTVITKKSNQKILDCHGNRICWRVQETMQS